jgi:GNAT superfamily N-acetyltransferase
MQELRSELTRKRHDSMWLGWMSVRPGHRGFGIGQKLLDFSVDKA